MLSLRTRGKNGIYYIRGSVALGDKKVDVQEFSTGTSDRDAASHLMAEHETHLRNRLLFGPAADVATGIIADAFESYLTKAKTPHPSDIIRIKKMNQVIGSVPLGQYREAWREFRTTRFDGHAPAGQDRYRAVLRAAINEHRTATGLDPVKIKAIPFNNQRVRWLTEEERDLLIRSYAAHVQRVIFVLAFQGPRVQDALQIQWGTQGVDLQRDAIKLNHEKTSTFQWVPMHERVRSVLLSIWEERGRPSSGHVFLNRRGVPYQDMRAARILGGNPLKKAYERTEAKRD